MSMLRNRRANKQDDHKDSQVSEKPPGTPSGQVRYKLQSLETIFHTTCTEFTVICLFIAFFYACMYARVCDMFLLCAFSTHSVLDLRQKANFHTSGQ